MTRDLTTARMLGAKQQGREKDDFYPTPPQATEALLRAESFTGDVWEPACGDGAISRVLQSHGHNVLSTDLIDRGFGTPRVDFLMEYKRRAPNIITNPPYKLALQFITKALELSNAKVAMLLRLAFLEGKTRRYLFTEYPLARVHVFSERINFARAGVDSGNGGGGMIAFAWFVWDHNRTSSQPTINWI